MTYQIAYGMDTESIEDSSQIVLLSLPDECADMDTDDLADFIGTNWGTPDVSAEPMVGVNDVVDSLRLLMSTENMTNEARERIITGLLDAIDNNG